MKDYEGSGVLLAITLIETAASHVLQAMELSRTLPIQCTATSAWQTTLKAAFSTFFADGLGVSEHCLPTSSQIELSKSRISK